MKNVLFLVPFLASAALSVPPTLPDTTAKFTLPSGVQVRIVEAPFDSSRFKVKQCPETRGSTPCLINGSIPFGIGWELPKTFVKSITISFKGQSYELDASQMFNAWGQRPLAFPAPIGVRYFGGKCFDSRNCQFRGLFSDGGGSFAAEWLIVDGVSLRTVLTYTDDIVGLIADHIDPPEFD